MTTTATPRLTTTVPRASLACVPEGCRLQLDLPGVSKEGVELTVEGRTLTITAQRSDAPPAGSEALHRGIRGSDYRRVFTLGREIDAERIAARLADGVLTVDLPKAEALLPRKVAIAA